MPFSPSPQAARVYGIVSDVFNVPANRVGPDSSPENIESWDSVHHLNLILALEQAFDVQFEPEEIDKMNSVKEVLSIISQKVEARA